MPVKTTFLLLLISISSFVFMNSGCGAAKTGNAFGSIDLPSVTPPATDPTPTPTDGDPVMNENSFYVAIKPQLTYTGHMSKQNNFNEACFIPKNTLTSQDIMCQLDVPESELFGTDLVLLYNAPKEMCRYVVRDTFWYYNRETGLGPSTVTTTVVQSSDPSATTYSCVIDGVTYGDRATCASGHREVSINFDNTDAPVLSCVYGDCCAGGYNRQFTITNPSGDVSVTAQNNVAWSSNFPTCIGGPGRTDWDSNTNLGFPRSVQSFAGDGYQYNYTIKSLISSQRTFTRHVANYYTPGLHDHSGFNTALVTSPHPFYIDPVDDRTGDLTGSSSSFPRGNAYYSLRCYDENYELIHRIRYQIREWDTREEYNLFISSSGTAGNPTNNGDGGVDCSGIDDGTFGSKCNDFHDADDFLNLNLAMPGYDTSGAITTRRNYFPFDAPNP